MRPTIRVTDREVRLHLRLAQAVTTGANVIHCQVNAEPEKPARSVCRKCYRSIEEAVGFEL